MSLKFTIDYLRKRIFLILTIIIKNLPKHSIYLFDYFQRSSTIIFFLQRKNMNFQWMVFIFSQNNVKIHIVLVFFFPLIVLSSNFLVFLFMLNFWIIIPLISKLLLMTQFITRFFYKQGETKFLFLKIAFWVHIYNLAYKNSSLGIRITKHNMKDNITKVLVRSTKTEMKSRSNNSSILKNVVKSKI